MADSHPGRVTSYLVLQAVGFTLPEPSPTPRCALTTPFHLCLFPPNADHRLCIFCGTFPDPPEAGRWPLATTVALSCSDFPPPQLRFCEAKRRGRLPDPLFLCFLLIIVLIVSFIIINIYCVFHCSFRFSLWYVELASP